VSKEYPNNICFLCGENLNNGSTIDEEHIFPKWVLRRYEKPGFFSTAIGLENQRQKFYSHKVRVHQICNRQFKSNLEDVVASKTYSDEVLWLWCLKIIVGLRVFTYGHLLVRSKTDSEKNHTLDEYPDDLNQFWEFSRQFFVGGQFQNLAKFTVVEIDYLHTQPNFFYHIHHELGVMMLMLGCRAFVVFFRDLLADERVQEFHDEWNAMIENEARSDEKIPAQNLYNIFCAKIAIYNYFSNYSRSANFGEGSDLWIENGIQWSEESEDGFYEAFSIKLVRKSGKIVAYEMVSDATRCARLVPG